MPDLKWLPLIYPAAASLNASMPRIGALATVGLHRSGSGVATQVSERLEVCGWGLGGWGQAIHARGNSRTANWGANEEADRASAWDTDREWGQAMSSGPYMNHA